MVARLDRFDNELAHGLYGAGDMFLMPSLFEPCGLSQLIAMRYGCVPVARETGGLTDTVEDGQTGFLFKPFDAQACWAALERALDCYSDQPARWRSIQQAGMAADWSWGRSARSYHELYLRAALPGRGAGA